MNPIRDAVIEHIQTCHEKGNQARGDELGQEEPRLSVSQIGHCPRMAIFEVVRYHPDHPLHVAPTHPFDDYVLEIMEAGNVWEHQQATCIFRSIATGKGGKRASVSRWGQNGLTAPRGALKRPADTQNLLKIGCSSAFLTHFAVSAGDFNHPRGSKKRAFGSCPR